MKQDEKIKKVEWLVKMIESNTMELLNENIDPSRACDTCKKQMYDGYHIGDCMTYYCTEKCLKKAHPNKEIKELLSDASTDDGQNYWTTWESPKSLLKAIKEQTAELLKLLEEVTQ